MEIRIFDTFVHFSVVFQGSWTIIMIFNWHCTSRFKVQNDPATYRHVLFAEVASNQIQPKSVCNPSGSIGAANRIQ